MLRCPICRFRKAQPKYKVEKYHYYECKNCKSVFIYPLPTNETIKTYYSSKFEYTTGQIEEFRIRKQANVILKKLKQLYPKGKTLLDIGSGCGYFLDQAQKLGLKPLGIEPSRKLYVQSSNRLHIDSVINSDFCSFFKKNLNKKFDFITAIHIIEHVLNPFLFIRQASQLLNRNGILYIETPNYDSWLAMAEKEYYTFFTPPDHIWLFCSKSLQSIVVRFLQLHIESVSTYSYPEHFMGILKRKLQMASVSRRNRSQINGKCQISNNKIRISFTKKLKFAFFDKLLAPLFTPLLNKGGYGSILELYIKKK